MRIELNEGDTLHHAEVTQRFETCRGAEMCVLKPGTETNPDHLIREMKQIGWKYHSIRIDDGTIVFYSPTDDPIEDYQWADPNEEEEKESTEDSRGFLGRAYNHLTNSF